MRGAGASDAASTRAGYRLDRLAEDLAAVLDAVRPGPARPPARARLGRDPGLARRHRPGFAARVASFTSISGPCLDHLADWFRRAPRTAALRQGAKSWYTLVFRMPVLPELGWRSGLFGRVTAASQRMPPPVVRDAVNGLELYRANIAATMAAPVARRTAVPVQVIAPRRDSFVSVSLARSAEPFADDFTMREIEGGHWVVRHRPELVADPVRTFVRALPPR